MKQIICVCTGNICRSPMAERLLQKAVNEAGLQDVRVISAGVAAYDGSAASSHSVRAMKEADIDLTDHRSQMLTKELIEESALILVMTQMHRIAIEQDFGKVTPPVLLWRENMPHEKQVGDPYGADYNTYKQCADSIAEAVPGWVEWIKKNLYK